jgi:hypothetical protein
MGTKQEATDSLSDTGFGFEESLFGGTENSGNLQVSNCDLERLLDTAKSERRGRSQCTYTMLTLIPRNFTMLTTTTIVKN